MADGQEDWQAQVEELVALQSIFDARFRLLTDVSGVGRDGSGDGDGACGEQPPDDEALMGLMGQPRPPCVAALRAEVLVDVDLPQGGVQIMLGGSGGGGANSSSGSSKGEGGGIGSAAAAAATAAGGGGGIPIGERVRWLPPLAVFFELPAAYPSVDPPKSFIRATWLSAAQAETLEAGLLEAWQEQGPGFPVLFTFLDSLRDGALERLGISGELLLQGPGSSGGVQQQCGGGCNSHCHHQKQQQQQQQQHDRPPEAEQVAVQLLRYHAAKEQEEFDASRQRCAVCFDELPGSTCLRLPGCGHFYCRACLRQLCSSNVREGSVEALRCPDPGCRQPLPPHVLQGLLTAEEFDRWETLLLQRTLDRMADLVYCPRCECPCIEDKDHFAQCAECLFAFCSLCCSSWHPGSECVDEEQALLIMSRRRARGGAGARDTRAEMDLVQQLASLKVLKEISKACPGCKMATEKTEGCNKMSCANCGAYWCWRCEVEISGYEHFKDGGCRLFEQAEIDRWNAMFAAERAEQLPQNAGPGRGVALGPMGAQRARVCHCPACGQATFQVHRNNLVRCWSCSQHYCVACRSILRGRVGQHYIGAGSCKQHG